MKQRMLRRVMQALAVAIVATVVFACYYALQGSTILFSCANDLKGEVVSPDKRYIAAYFVRDCGATTDFATHVSIRSAARNFDAEKDVRLFTAEGICDLAVEWAGEGLHIHHELCNVRRKNEEWRGLKVFVDET